MSIEVGLLEQSIANVPREISGGLAQATGNIALHTRIVVGLLYPGEDPIVARGYEPLGNENNGTKITLEADQAERLAEAYVSAMIEKPDGAIVQCDSFVDFVMGWRSRLHHTLADTFQFSRSAEYSPEPVELNSLEDGAAYDFVIPKLHFGEPGTVHVALGTNKPERNLSKFGNDALITMRTIDSVHRYATRKQLAIPQKLVRVSSPPRS